MGFVDFLTDAGLTGKIASVPKTPLERKASRTSKLTAMQC